MLASRRQNVRGVMTRTRNALVALAFLAGLVVAALSSAVPAAVAQDPPPRLHGHIPVNGGVGLLLWDGGLTLALIAEAERAGCSVASVYVNRPDGGEGLLSYIPRARIQTVNRPYLQAFPSGLLDSTPVLLSCRPHIRGVVVDAEGRPSRGVQVTAMQAYPFGHNQYRTRTGEDGSFDFVVDRGTYTLSVYTGGTAGGTQVGWYVPGGITTDRGGASRIELRSVGIADIVIALQTTYPVSGVVLDSDGSPNDDFHVVAQGESGSFITTRQRLGRDGRFTLHVPGPEPVTVVLFRRSRGNNTWQRGGWYGPGGYSTNPSDASFVRPGTPEAADIEIILPPFWTIGGWISGPGGEGRGDIFVRAYRDTVQLASSTRANGRFAFSMPEGPVRLVFAATVRTGIGYAVRHFGWYGDGAVTTAPSQAREIDLRDEDVEIRLRIPELRRITGQIHLPPLIDLPEATEPRAVSVRLRSYAATGARGEFVTAVRVAEDGRFELAVLDGTYALELLLHDGRGTVLATYDPISRTLSACGTPMPFTIEADARAREITLTEEMFEGRACP